MKLRNKKTGEIRELPDGFFCGDNLKKICEEWEDAPEEPKAFFEIEWSGDICKTDVEGHEHAVLGAKQIGNYFSSREEAELVVRKFKAWKRLKDKGFRFKGINEADGSIKTGLSKRESILDCEGFYDDITLLFGGEE